jgi:hypothetical protein
MITKKLPDKQSREQAKEKPETGYFSSHTLRVQKPVLKAETYYISYSTDYLSRKGELPIFEFEQKVYRILQRQRRPRANHLLSILKKAYNIPNSADVAVFLDKHPGLADFVLEAAKHIRKYFPYEKLSLEVVSDPEMGEDEELFSYILTSLSVEDALQKLNNFDEQWFLNQLDRTGGLFNFNLKFV